MRAIIGFQLDISLESSLKKASNSLKITNIDTEKKQQRIITEIEKESIRVDAVIIGSTVKDPISMVQRLHFIDKNISVIILCPPDTYHQMLDAIQFAPFLGEEVSCHSIENSGELIIKIENAVANTHRRRKYKDALARMNVQIPGQNSLQLQTARYVDRLLDSAPIGVILIDNNYKILAWNKKAESLFDKTERNALGISFLLFFSSKEQEQIKSSIAPKRSPNIPNKQTFQREIQKKVPQFLEVTATQLDNAQNSTLIIVEDITERKKAEEETKRSEERFRTLIEQSTDAIQLVSPEGTILYTSESIKNVLGYTSEELQGLGVVPFMHPDDLAYFNEKFNELLKIPGDQVTLQYRVKHKDGSWAWLETTGVNHLQTPNINALVGTFRNITERKKHEEELRYQKTLLETQREVAPEGVLVVSPDGKMVSYNTKFVNMWQFSNKLMMKGKDEQALQEATQQLKDPELFIKRVQEIYKSHKPNFTELRFKDGRVFDRYGAPLIGEDGTDYGYVWFFQDVTQRKRLERQKDEFISIASHELKTPVTSIKSFGQVLRLRFKKESNEKAVELLGKMDAQVDKLTNLIGDLLDVTKMDTGRVQYNNDYFDFDDLISELVEEMQRTTGKHSLLQKGKTNKKIYADRERIGQVLTNLISNAIKYSPHTDKIIVQSATEKGKVKVCVQDFGVGIPKEKLDKVFERFFRISGPGKETFPGLGLGLYISSEIIKRQSGRIWVESAVGKGSVFCFTLPIKAKDGQRNNLVEEDIKHA
ncbi:MAG: PAS domain S-box protein [Candidatus Levyibacteriota bacterium]